MKSIRNIAIIAHVDHGKTTLVDKIIDQCQVLDERKERTELLLDNNDLERERGITILSKNVSVNYKGNFMWSMSTPNGNGFAPIVFLVGIIALMIYIYIYSKKQKQSDLDNVDEKSEDKDITKKEFKNKTR